MQRKSWVMTPIKKCTIAAGAFAAVVTIACLVSTSFLQLLIRSALLGFIPFLVAMAFSGGNIHLYPQFAIYLGIFIELFFLGLCFSFLILLIRSR
jgi:hypothetical protein